MNQLTPKIFKKKKERKKNLCLIGADNFKAFLDYSVHSGLQCTYKEGHSLS